MSKKHNGVTLDSRELDILRHVNSGYDDMKELLRKLNINNRQFNASYQRIQSAFETNNLTLAASKARMAGII